MAEWQAAQAIKIEALSLTARALLIQAGARTIIHTFSLLCHFSMCVFIYSQKSTTHQIYPWVKSGDLTTEIDKKHLKQNSLTKYSF